MEVKNLRITFASAFALEAGEEEAGSEKQRVAASGQMRGRQAGDERKEVL